MSFDSEDQNGIAALIRAGGGRADVEDPPPTVSDLPHGGPMERRPIFAGAHDVAAKLSVIEAYAASLNSDFQRAPEDVRSAWSKHYQTWLAKVDGLKGRTWLVLNIGARGFIQELAVDEREFAVWRAKLEASGVAPTAHEPVASAPFSSTSSHVPLPEREVIVVGAESVKSEKGFTFSSFLKWLFAIVGVFGVGYVLKSFAEAAHGTSGFVNAIRGGDKSGKPVTGKNGIDEMALANAIAEARTAELPPQPMNLPLEPTDRGWRAPWSHSPAPQPSPYLLHEYEYFEPPPPPPRAYQRSAAVITLPDGRSAVVKSPEHAAELLREARNSVQAPQHRPWYRR